MMRIQTASDSECHGAFLNESDDAQRPTSLPHPKLLYDETH